MQTCSACPPGPSMALTVMREPGMSTTTFLESSSPSRYRSLKESLQAAELPCSASRANPCRHWQLKVP